MSPAGAAPLPVDRGEPLGAACSTTSTAAWLSRPTVMRRPRPRPATYLRQLWSTRTRTPDRPQTGHRIRRTLGSVSSVARRFDVNTNQLFKATAVRRSGRPGLVNAHEIAVHEVDRHRAGVACVVLSFRRVLLALACDAIIRPQRRSRLETSLGPVDPGSPVRHGPSGRWKGMHAIWEQLKRVMA